MRFLENIIHLTRLGLTDPNSSAMRQPYLCSLLNRPVTAADVYTNHHDEYIRRYFLSSFPEIHLQDLVLDNHGRSFSGVIYINYELAHAVSNAPAYPTNDRYSVNALMLLLTTLYHEYAHLFGQYAHAGDESDGTPGTLGERGWAVEEHMFGGKLQSNFHPSDERLARIQDLSLERDGERISISELYQIIMT